MNYTYIIWDFNGTILDDVKIGLDSLNVLLKRRGLPEIESTEKYKAGFMFPIIEGYKRYGFDFEKESYDDVAKEWVDEYVSREHTAGLVDGVREVLEFFKTRGVKQAIISASEMGMLKRQLEQLGICEYFEDIVGMDNIKAAGKKDIAVAWKNRHPHEKLLFIGDTDHDHQVAMAMEADCILVAAGHQSFDRLQSMEPKIAVFANVRGVMDLL